jgi:hypothetical protein
MEIDMPRRMEKDRIMWFSMWFLASVASFGIAFFPMFYFLIDRRNRHFRQQLELEIRAAGFLKNSVGEKVQASESVSSERNAALWAVSIVLVFPVFVIAYFLSEDLLLHEQRQQVFLKRLFPDRDYPPQIILVRRYLLVTLATLGVGVIYWLYRVLNMYNNHFKEHRKIDEEIVKLMEAKSHGAPL